MPKKVLITGGTGFLGKRLALALKQDHEVFLSGRNNGQNMAAERFTECPVIPMDVARIDSVRDAMVESRPDIVIHAAATKYVDLAEKQPFECLDVNVLGSENVARVALERGVETLIGISTDKAAPPAGNVYAMTKALMERLFCALDRQGPTKFVCVRFGNLPWSTGSVFPEWRRMHEKTGVIQTTGPDMRRFFITVDEAVQLVLTAIKHADELRGTVVTRAMKAALIGDILDLWIADKGGSWERIARRPGDRDDESIMGESERPYARIAEFDGAKHYVISFERRAEAVVEDGLSSTDAPRLTDEEIRAILANPPSAEEL